MNGCYIYIQWNYIVPAGFTLWQLRIMHCNNWTWNSSWCSIKLLNWIANWIEYRPAHRAPLTLSRYLYRVIHVYKFSITIQIHLIQCNLKQLYTWHCPVLVYVNAQYQRQQVSSCQQRPCSEIPTLQPSLARLEPALSSLQSYHSNQFASTYMCAVCTCLYIIGVIDWRWGFNWHLSFIVLARHPFYRPGVWIDQTMPEHKTVNSRVSIRH